MAKINPVKLKQEADKLEKANRLEQAIALYRQVVDDNPRDWNTINKVGDLYAKLNKNHEACEEYAKVADFYAKDGFLLKAIALWKKINRLEPASLGPYVNLAELYAKQGLMMEAKGQYQIVVEEYIKRGKMRDAGDVLKKMAEIDPADLKVRSKLADLYKREGNVVKAIEEHVAIADELLRKGHLNEAVQVLENGLKIDPKHSRLRLELARVYGAQKNFEKAAHVLEEAVRQAPGEAEPLARLGEAYLGAKRIEEAESVFRRLLEINPQDADARTQIGRVALLQGQFDRAYEQLLPLVDQLLERREGERGAQLLQEIVQASPGHLSSLVKLAEVYRVLQKDAQVAAVYSQLTEAYIQQGFMEQAASVLEMLVTMDPQNQQHRSKLEFVRSRRGAPSGRQAQPSTASGGGVEIEEEFELGEAEIEEFPGLDEQPAPPARVAPAPRVSQAPPVPPPSAGGRPTIELSPPLSEDDREFVDEHLAEGKVFRKYGLIDKAVEQFEAIVARFPDHAEARQELRDVFREKGQLDRAAAHVRALAQICRLKGDEAGARAHERELGEQAAPAAAVPAAGLSLLPPVPLAAEELEVPIEVGELPPPEEEEVAFSVDVTDEAEEELSAQFGEEEEAPAASAPAFFPPEEEEIELPLAEAAESAASEQGLGEVFAPTAEDEELPAHFVEEEEEQQPLARPLVAEPAASAPSAEALPADLRRGLDEVDEYSALGFVEDARQALRELRGRYPDHPVVQARSRDLGIDREAAAPATVTEEEFPGLDVPGLEFPGSAEEALAPGAGDEEFPGLDLSPALAGAADLGDELAGLGLPEAAPPAAAETIQFPGLDLPEAAPLPEPETVDLSGLGLPEAAPFAEPETVDFPGLDLPVAEPAAAELAATEAFAGLDLPGFEEEQAAPAAPPAEALDEALGGLDLTVPEPAAEFGLTGAEPAPFPEPADELDAVLGAPAPAQEPGLDLGAELFSTFAAVEEPPHEAVSDSLGEAGLADIFREFKKGVDKQLGQEDYDTRYNLGIAYKEMGLVDEAIAEFQLAAKDPTRLLECSSMLGICFLEKGMPKLAVKWFEKGLQAPGRSEDEYLGLRYDLASAYEADGDLNKAVGILLDLHSQDDQFRDVGERLRALRAAGAQP